MADTLKKLASYPNLPAASTVVYTAPADVKTVMTEIVLCNKTAAAVNITLTVDGTTFLSAKPVAANDSLFIKTNTIIETGATIQASAATANAIDLYISGVEVA